MSVEKGHYYTYNGILRPDANLTIAKQQLLYPSVTTLMQTCMPVSFGLQNYKDEQLVTAARTLPDRPEWTDKDFFEAAKVEAKKDALEAAERGTALHAAIARYQEGKPSPDLPHDVREFLADNLYRYPEAAVETTMVGREIGFAGTIDYWGRVNCSKLGPGVPALIDFKTHRLKEDKEKPSWSDYDSWLYQLGGYGALVHMDPNVPEELHPRAYISVVINTNHRRDGYTPERPGIWYREWDIDLIYQGAEVIRTLVDQFYAKNNKKSRPYPRPGTPERAAAERELFGQVVSALPAPAAVA